jgi:hypothetical protein
MARHVVKLHEFPVSVEHTPMINDTQEASRFGMPLACLKKGIFLLDDLQYSLAVFPRRNGV